MWNYTLRENFKNKVLSDGFSKDIFSLQIMSKGVWNFDSKFGRVKNDKQIQMTILG